MPSFFVEVGLHSAIDRLSIGKDEDHDGLVAEHLIYAQDMPPLLARMFNAAIMRASPKVGALTPIIPILNVGDSMIPNNLAGLYVFMLEHEFNIWAEKHRMRAQEQASRI